jgi:hypothetical protein
MIRRFCQQAIQTRTLPAFARWDHHSAFHPYTRPVVDDAHFDLTLKIKFLENQLETLTKRVQTLEFEALYADVDSRVFMSEKKVDNVPK